MPEQPFLSWLILMILHHPLVGWCNGWLRLMIRCFLICTIAKVKTSAWLGEVCEMSVTPFRGCDDSWVGQTSVGRPDRFTEVWMSYRRHVRFCHVRCSEIGIGIGNDVIEDTWQGFLLTIEVEGRRCAQEAEMTSSNMAAESGNASSIHLHLIAEPKMCIILLTLWRLGMLFGRIFIEWLNNSRR